MQNKIYWTLAAGFLAAYCVMMACSIVNLPYSDDYEFFLNFLNEWNKSSTLLEKWHVLTTWHVGYRITTGQLLVLLWWKIFGTLNIAILLALCNIGVLVAACLLYLWNKASKNNGLLALLVVLLLMNGQLFRTTTWLPTAMQAVLCCVFAVLAIDLLLRNKKWSLTIGILTSALTIFSTGNGFAIIPAVCVVLWLQNHKRKAIYFAASMCVVTVFYFMGYQQSSLDHALQTDTTNMLSNLPVMAFNFFSILGCFLYIPSLKIISFAVGLFFVFTYGYAFYKKYYTLHPQWFAYFTFILFTGAIIACGRTYMGTLWYRLHFAGIYVLAAVFWLNYCRTKNLRIPVILMLAGAVVHYVVMTFLYYGTVQQLNADKHVQAYRYILWQDSSLAVEKNSDFSFDIYKNNVLMRAEENGIYSIDRSKIESITSPLELHSSGWQDKQSNITYDIDYIVEYKNNTIIRGYAVVLPMQQTRISLYLFTANDTIKIQPMLERRFDDNIIQQSKDAIHSGFYAIIPREEIPHGTYQLGIEIKRVISRKTYSITTNKTIEI